MYNRFFGLREMPFKLVPNPDYLFLGKSHEEALAHLEYAVSQGDGFVEITGEVGTGKTTLCRVFLDRLDSNIETAFIFNPKLDANQLLKSIVTEFGLRNYGPTTKELVDSLNQFLLVKHSRGQKVILLIDEAQNLSAETLELIRMLSNLETTRSKLMQIILVGQPELSNTLDSYEMRQLSQRITLSCRLTPLSHSETFNYIQHRLRVAAHLPDQVIFTAAALQAIYRYSGGIPRLINVACDRALLAAYSLKSEKVTGAIARAAIREVSSRGRWEAKRFHWPKALVGLAAAAVLAIVAALLSNALHHRLQPPANSDSPAVSAPPPVAIPVPQESEAAPLPVGNARVDAKVSEVDPPAMPASDLETLFTQDDPLQSRRQATARLLKAWGIEPHLASYLDRITEDFDFFAIVAKQYNLQVLDGDFGWELIHKLDLPAIVVLKQPSGQPLFLALTGMLNDSAILDSGGEDGPLQMGTEMLQPYFPGQFYVFWKNFLSLTPVTVYSAPQTTVVNLKLLLRDIGFASIKISPVFDDQTRLAVKEVQAKYGLVVDGKVGPLTTIVLYNEKRTLPIPHLTDLHRDG